jgi:hypothetical protein
VSRSPFGLGAGDSARLPKPKPPGSEPTSAERYLWSQQDYRNWLEANPQPPQPVVYNGGIAHDTGRDQAVVDAIKAGKHRCGPRCTKYGDKFTDPGYGPCRESWPWVDPGLIKPRRGQLAKPQKRGAR